MLNGDFINNLIEIIKSTGANFKQTNGRIEFKTKAMEGSHPWRYVKHDQRTNCTLWKTVMYDYLCKRLLPEKDRFIPQGCQECYKVVVRPKKYKELFELEALIARLDKSGKCGCETRHTVKGLYGGYFYNRGLDEGLESYEEVRKEIDPAIPVILKRGCTGFELKHGPSDKWFITPKQIEIEAEVKERIFVDPYQPPQTLEDIERVYKLWKNFAWKLDPTYRGEELYPKYVVYHKE